MDRGTQNQDGSISIRASNAVPMPILPEERLPRILMVEDNPGDAYLLKQALAEAGFRYTMTVAPNGDDALTLLKENQPPQRPDMILLDLNLPGKSGHEVLREIKEDAELRSVPVIVFSSSEAESDMALAYDLHANCYIHKPTGLAETLRVAEHLASFWFCSVRLPRRQFSRQKPGRAAEEDESRDGPARRPLNIREERFLKRA